MNSNYTFTYVIIHYDCGHTCIRPVLRMRVETLVRRSLQRCSHCSEQLASRYATAREEQEEQMEEAGV